MLRGLSESCTDYHISVYQPVKIHELRRLVKPYSEKPQMGKNGENSDSTSQR